jgi:hypothetical protein
MPPSKSPAADQTNPTSDTSADDAAKAAAEAEAKAAADAAANAAGGDAKKTAAPSDTRVIGTAESPTAATKPGELKKLGIEILAEAKKGEGLIVRVLQDAKRAWKEVFHA